MVHPKPAEPWREALFAWLIGKPFDRAQLPAEVRDLLDWRAVAEGVSDLAHGVDVPDVPFLMLTDRPLVTAQWARLAERMGWQALRMNLNTLARHGVFELPDMADKVARRLADTAAVKAARAYPYQLLAAYRSVDAAVPEVVRQGLQDALDAALANVPVLGGDVVVCPDVSGSMRSPVTGYRAGATTRVRCVDVAGLIAAALLRTHPTARVLPFEQKVVDVRLNPRDSVLTNAEKLAAVGGGGTHCSAPLAWLADKAARVDVVIMVSDNESWVDGRRHGATATMREWARIKRRNPDARLVCIDLQPYGTTQANEQSDILNVGGFGDAVFDVIAQFASGGFGAGHWVEAIESIRIEGT
jgi:60 kDa SS-A/Ro ribonucleoprotein